MSSPVSLLPQDDPDSLLRAIGHTPLIPLVRIGAGFPRVQILLKAEWLNPGGSVKDRPAYRMIRAAEVSGQMTKEKTILDATSGNTGIAYAMIGARRGYHVKLLMPSNASVERKKLLVAYGAELMLTDPAEGSDGAFFATQRLYKDHPDLYFYPDQYGNPENPRAHYETTAVEIIEQTKGEITHFIAGLGTSGTLMGTGKRLREFNPQIQLIAMQPEGPFHGLEGLKHLETASHVPALFDPKFADQTIGIATEAAQEMAVRLTREEGLYVGISAGAAVCAAMKLATTIDRGIIVAICPDGGARYQSEKFWEKK
ncbi:MAG TPA: cysteine synthase family protein [Verrucomicrobiae bacterium]|nr:cysteine synthase family protein [Verrucomicrobiae bacterium]